MEQNRRLVKRAVAVIAIIATVVLGSVGIGDIVRAEVVHECSKYLVTKYNGAYHWKQCSVCGATFDKSSHSYVDTWTMGNSCSSKNKCIHTCSCGYNYTTGNTRQHTTTGVWSSNESYHVQKCAYCGEEIEETKAKHTNAHGSIIQCSGTCSICGTTLYHHSNVTYSTKKDTFSGDGLCDECNIALLSVSDIQVSYNIIGKQFTFSANIPLNGSMGLVYPVIVNYNYGAVINNFNYSMVPNNYNGTTQSVSIQATGEFNGTEDISNYHFAFGNSVSTFSFFVDFVPDKTAPTVTSVSFDDLYTSNGWATKRQFNIVGSENYCGTVQFAVYDWNGVKIQSGKTTVTNGVWQHSFTPNIEVKGNKQFTIETKDTFGNAGSTTFYTANIDGIAPQITTGTGETGKEWSKEKSVTFTCTDKGSGKVRLSVDGINYTSMAESDIYYNVMHKFTEEVYGSKKYRVYYVDYTGNTSVKDIIVYNIDTTAPKVESAEVEVGLGQSNIYATANDIKAELGIEGSGVDEYGISRDASGNIEWQKGRTFTVTDIGKYYIWAKDKAGNISECVEVNVTINSKVIFETQYGNCDIKEKIFEYGDNYSELPEPSRDGWQFVGWFTEECGKGTQIYDGMEVIEQEELHVYAHWKRNISVEFNLTGGKYKGSNSNVRLRGEIYDSSEYYEFYVNGAYNLSGDTWSEQQGSINMYGESYDENGLNSDFTKVTYCEGNGKQVKWRLVGWTDSQCTEIIEDGEVISSDADIEILKPKESYEVRQSELSEVINLCIYSDNKIDSIKTFNSITLYAVWEPVLEVDVQFRKTLDIAWDSISIGAVSYGQIVQNGFRTSEQADYNISTYGCAESIDVKFEEEFTEVYRLAETKEEFSKYNDNLNDNLFTQGKSFDKSVELDKQKMIGSCSGSFNIPTYIEEYQKYKEIATNKSSYAIDVEVCKESVYYRYRYNTKETAKATIYVCLGTQNGITAGGIKEDIEWIIHSNQ